MSFQFPQDWDINQGFDTEQDVQNTIVRDVVNNSLEITKLNRTVSELCATVTQLADMLQVQQSREARQVCENREDHDTHEACEDRDKKQNASQKPKKNKMQTFVPVVKRIKTTDPYSYNHLAQVNGLTSEESRQLSIIAQSLASMFYRKKPPTNTRCFVASIFFVWLCRSDCLGLDFVQIAEWFAFVRKFDPKLNRTSEPVEYVWKQIMDREFIEIQNSTLDFEVFDNSLDCIQYDCQIDSIGCALQQIHYIDCIRNFDKEHPAEKIGDWCFTYLCLCILYGGSGKDRTSISHAAHVVTLSFLRHADRIPFSVFNDGVVYDNIFTVVQTSNDSPELHTLMCVLNTLHENRGWKYFLQTHERSCKLASTLKIYDFSTNRNFQKFRVEINGQQAVHFL